MIGRLLSMPRPMTLDATASPWGLRLTLPSGSEEWLRTLLISTWLLNLMDALLTLGVVSTGLAVEANPVMAAALEQGPHVFLAAKLALVSAGTLVMWRLRWNRFALVGALVVFAAYIAVSLVHIQSVKALVHLLA